MYAFTLTRGKIRHLRTWRKGVHLAACGMKGWQRNDALVPQEVTCKRCMATQEYKRKLKHQQ